MVWRFHPMSPGDLNIDPVEGEFFATETLGGITDALVREAIQNSLDAAAEERVRVRFCLGTAVNATRERYLGGLRHHVEAAHEARTTVPNREEPLRFVAVEDEGTRGLEGDPDQFEDDGAGDGCNDFYYFWRNVGRSRKQSTERGRWGLGKTVFAAASRLNSFFGLTLRRSDGRSLLMGQAVLKIHRFGGRRYRPYGYYGAHQDDFSMPLDDCDLVREFEQSFALRRVNRSGLSIVIPYPDDEITAERLLESTLHHYFHPLLAGKLEVEVKDGEEAPVVLCGEMLEREVCRRSSLRKLLRLIQLARWGSNPERESVAVLAAPAAGRAPKLTEELFVVSDLERLRRRYDEGKRIVLELRLVIERLGNAPQEAGFRLLMERDTQEQCNEGYFVRQGITIENSKARRPRGVRWILDVDDPILSAFLGDAENPAHTEWQRSSPKFKEKYRLGASTLDFVRSAPAIVTALLSRPAEGRDHYLLRDIFSLSDEAAMSSRQRPEATRNGTEDSTVEESIPATLGKSGRLVLGKVRTGFRLRGRLGEAGPRRLEILAAYDVLRGNPFQRYSSLDFRMDKSITVLRRGARIVARHDNRLEIEIEAPEFVVLVTRFDENRDLRVKVRPLEERS
jgi:hypothetical protein